MAPSNNLHPPAAGAHVLLTGATGFVGKVVLAELVRRREALGIASIQLLIRPRRGQSPEARFAEVVASPCFDGLPPDWPALCRVVAGDICENGLALAPSERARLAASVTHIIHGAASVQFNMPLAEATRVNVTGALGMLDLARECAVLRSMVYVSTAYVTPHPGDQTEVPEALHRLPLDAEATYADIGAGRANEAALLGATGHPNTYTFTKCLAENLLAERRESVPLVVVRPSIIAACRQRPFPGWIDSKAAYAAFVSLYGAGYLHVMCADPQSRVDVVPCDEVVARILAGAFEPSRWARGELAFIHAVAGYANSSTNGQAVASWERFFNARPSQPRPYVGYLGPAGLRLRWALWRHHELPLRVAGLVATLTGRSRPAAAATKLLGTLRSINQVFPYFTHHTFRFRAAMPLDGGFEVGAYLDLVSQGVSRHLLKREEHGERLSDRAVSPSPLSAAR